jgi:hypothetical protein
MSTTGALVAAVGAPAGEINLATYQLVVGAPLQIEDRGDGSAWAWTIAAAPVGSVATIVDPALRVMTFTADVSGTWVFRCRVDGGATPADDVSVGFCAPLALPNCIDQLPLTTGLLQNRVRIPAMGEQEQWNSTVGAPLVVSNRGWCGDVERWKNIVNAYGFGVEPYYAANLGTPAYKLKFQIGGLPATVAVNETTGVATVDFPTSTSEVFSFFELADGATLTPNSINSIYDATGLATITLPDASTCVGCRIHVQQRMALDVTTIQSLIPGQIFPADSSVVMRVDSSSWFLAGATKWYALFP